MFWDTFTLIMEYFVSQFRSNPIGSNLIWFCWRFEEHRQESIERLTLRIWDKAVYISITQFLDCWLFDFLIFFLLDYFTSQLLAGPFKYFQPLNCSNSQQSSNRTIEQPNNRAKKQYTNTCLEMLCCWTPNWSKINWILQQLNGMLHRWLLRPVMPVAL